MKTRLTLLLFTVVTLASVGMQARADLLLDITNSTGGDVGEPVAGDSVTVGFSFSLAQTFSVTSLGIWDESGNGLVKSHEVGLWTYAGDLLASATVPSGSAGTFVASADSGPQAGSGWRFTSLASSLILGPGDYVLGAFYSHFDTPTDVYISNVSGIQTVAGATFGTSRITSDTDGPFKFPDVIDEDGVGLSDFGPNLQFSAVTAVPEPSTLAMGVIGGLALAGAGAYRRRRLA